MIRLILYWVLLITTALVHAEVLEVFQTPAGRIEIDNGHIVVNGARLYFTRQYDGRQVSLDSEHVLSRAGKNPGLFLSIYRDKVVSTELYRTQHIIIIDAAGKELRSSNALDTGINFEWGDNNYVLFDNGAMYFGIFTPKRMQFVYRNGKLEENKGAWSGPA